MTKINQEIGLYESWLKEANQLKGDAETKEVKLPENKYSGDPNNRLVQYLNSPMLSNPVMVSIQAKA